jgi:hypothetical protein
MSAETAQWLISRPQTARQLVKAGQALGYKQLPDPDSLKGNIYRWEHGTGALPPACIRCQGEGGRGATGRSGEGHQVSLGISKSITHGYSACPRSR